MTATVLGYCTRAGRQEVAVTSWDMTTDGKRFLMTVEPNQGQQNESTPITVVLNWQADLKK